jgi:hypothetical protein
MHRLHVAPGHVGHQQLDRVGANINDGAANGFHEPSDYEARLRNPKRKNVTFLYGVALNPAACIFPP